MTIYEPFIPTTDEVIAIKLGLAEIRPGERVFDLGCGDGRVLIAAARDHGANCVGYEIRPDLAKQAQEAVRRNGLEDSVRIVRGNLMNADISTADILVLYLSQEVTDLVTPKLEAELREGSRVVAQTFPLPGWTPTRRLHVKTSGRHLDEVSLYVVRKGDG